MAKEKEIKTEKTEKVETKKPKLDTDILLDVVTQDHIFAFRTVGSSEEVKSSGEIFANRLYRQELLPYIQKYGYDRVNEFCLNFVEEFDKHQKL